MLLLPELLSRTVVQGGAVWGGLCQTEESTGEGNLRGGDAHEEL